MAPDPADTPPPVDEGQAARDDDSSKESVPAIGSPTPPPAALVVAVSSKLSDHIRSARLKQLLRNSFGVLVGEGVDVGDGPSEW